MSDKHEMRMLIETLENIENNNQPSIERFKNALKDPNLSAEDQQSILADMRELFTELYTKVKRTGFGFAAMKDHPETYPAYADFYREYGKFEISDDILNNASPEFLLELIIDLDVYITRFLKSWELSTANDEEPLGDEEEDEEYWDDEDWGR